MSKTTYNCLVADTLNHSVDDFSSMQVQWQERPMPVLSQGQVQIAVEYSGMNYKDALALTGKGKILRGLPLVPGIDAAGKVLASRSLQYQEGDSVLVTGCGLGETQDGGYSEIMTVPESWVIKTPPQWSSAQAMILGTAGFTAGLALHQMEKNGLHPSQGEVLVTGASGGVGALSLLLLKAKGYTPVAWTRSQTKFDFLKKLGAHNVELIPTETTPKPLMSAQWAGAIDNVGGSVLAQILPAVKPHGSVSAIGLAKSALFEATVFPFILRGVNLLGISSTSCPRALRETIWSELSQVNAPWENSLTETLGPQDILNYAQKMVAGKTSGRAIVRLQ